MIDRLVAFDTETSGFSPSRHTLIEIGAVQFALDGTVLGTWQQFAHPGKPLDEEIVRLTGITDDMLHGAPPAVECARAFLEWAGEGSVFLAHNADFDQRFLNACFLGAGEFAPRMAVIDTLAWARTAGWPVADHKLGTLLAHVGHRAEGLHRALADADGVRALTLALLQGAPDPVRVLLDRLQAPKLPAPKTGFDLPG